MPPESKMVPVASSPPVKHVNLTDVHLRSTKLRSVAVALFAFVFPFVAANLGLAWIASGHGSPPPTATPHPAPAPSWFLSPFDRLVEHDPRFAGTFLISFCALAFLLTATLVAYLVVDCSQQSKTGERVLPSALIGLSLGLLLATPWIYVLVKTAV